METQKTCRKIHRRNIVLIPMGNSRMHVNNVYVTHKVSARVFLPVWNGDVRDVPIRVLDFSLLILLG